MAVIFAMVSSRGKSLPKINTEFNNILEEDENEEMEDTIDPGPMPKNLYNIGIKENVKEVFYPRSLRKDALIKWAKFIIEKKRQKMDETLHSNSSMSKKIN